VNQHATIEELLEAVFSVSVPRLYSEDQQEKSISKMFAMLDKAKPDIESIRGLNLAAVKHTAVQVSRLPL
jgi:hypothetical protein